MEIWATGREEADAAGLNPIAKYDHRWENVPGTLKGRYCFTEEGTVRFEYLPVGSYILAEKKRLPVMPQRIQFYLRSQIPVIWKNPSGGYER